MRPGRRRTESDLGSLRLSTPPRSRVPAKPSRSPRSQACDESLATACKSDVLLLQMRLGKLLRDQCGPGRDQRAPSRDQGDSAAEAVVSGEEDIRQVLLECSDPAQVVAQGGYESLEDAVSKLAIKLGLQQLVDRKMVEVEAAVVASTTLVGRDTSSLPSRRGSVGPGGLATLSRIPSFLKLLDRTLGLHKAAQRLEKGARSGLPPLGAAGGGHQQQQQQQQEQQQGPATGTPPSSSEGCRPDAEAYLRANATAVARAVQGSVQLQQLIMPQQTSQAVARYSAEAEASAERVRVLERARETDREAAETEQTRLRRELDACRAGLKLAEQAAQAALQAKDESHRHYKTASKRLGASEASVASLTKQLGTWTKKAQQADAACKAAQRELKAAEASSVSSGHRLSERLHALEAAAQRCEAGECASHQSQSQVAAEAQAQALSLSQAREEEFQKKMEESQKKLDASQKEFQSIHQELSLTLQRCRNCQCVAGTKLGLKVAELEGKLAEVTAASEESQSRMEEMETEHAELQVAGESLAALRAGIEERDAVIDALEREAGQCSGVQCTVSDELRAQIRTLEDRIKELEAQVLICTGMKCDASRELRKQLYERETRVRELEGEAVAAESSRRARLRELELELRAAKSETAASRSTAEAISAVEHASKALSREEENAALLGKVETFQRLLQQCIELIPEATSELVRKQLQRVQRVYSTATQEAAATPRRGQLFHDDPRDVEGGSLANALHHATSRSQSLVEQMRALRTERAGEITRATQSVEDLQARVMEQARQTEQLRDARDEMALRLEAMERETSRQIEAAVGTRLKLEETLMRQLEQLRDAATERQNLYQSLTDREREVAMLHAKVKQQIEPDANVADNYEGAMRAEFSSMQSAYEGKLSQAQARLTAATKSHFDRIAELSRQHGNEMSSARNQLKKAEAKLAVLQAHQ